ncbi:hypothetical protein PNF30_13185 [Bacillus safensis]|uniref:hypothetical protein n=1 Tax=Bacillus safensis TaxID=561879 RepID=UPI002342E9B6|nr:hypothetical protein [Bacillus safensis]WCL56469.1 hypothetical protein PNF30_13185 [Bacillus safensis]
MLNKVQIFNPKDGQFKNSAYDLPEGRVSAVAAIVDDQLYVIGGRNYSYYMGNFSAKSDYKSVISIPLSDLQITEDEAKPDEGATEEPKDQDGTKPGDGSTEEPKDQDGTKPDGGTTEEPKDQDGTKPGDGTTEEPKDQDGTKPGEEATKGILSITMINGLQKDYERNQRFFKLV